MQYYITKFPICMDICMSNKVYLTLDKNPKLYEIRNHKVKPIISHKIDLLLPS